MPVKKPFDISLFQNGFSSLIGRMIAYLLSERVKIERQNNMTPITI